MQTSLSNKVIVVTGAARGIGQAVARSVLRSGGKLVALDRLWDEGDAFYGELHKRPDAVALSCDISSAQQIAEALRITLERFGAPDVLVNNAAMRQRDFFPADGACAVLDTTDEQWQRMFEVNVIGQVRITRAFIQPMIARRRGHIINVSAPGGVTYVRDGDNWTMGPHLRLNQPYDASKAAFSNMSFYLAEEVREHGIAVNMVFPGAIRSTGVDEMQKGRKKLGLELNVAEPEQVVPLMTYLASLEGTSITGRTFSAVTWNSKQAGGQATSIPTGATR